jgi:hypothetical protein
MTARAQSSDLARIAHDPGAFEAFYRAHVEAIVERVHPTA